MSASAAARVVSLQPATAPEEDVLIHVRYSPSAEIYFIDARPENKSAREWLNLLLDNAPDRYQALAGGRGFFRIPRSQFGAILAQAQ